MEKANKKVNAALIIIGNEILSGRTQDINVMNLSKWLNELGVKVEEIRIVPDNEIAIVHTVNFLRKRFNYIFTTGGIGPTHDDITAKSIAKAFNLKYGKHNEAYKLLENYYGPKNFTTGRKKMAKLPIKAPKFDARRYPIILKIINKIPININSKRYLIVFIIFSLKNS